MFKRTRKFIDNRIKGASRGMGMNIIKGTWEMIVTLARSFFAVPSTSEGVQAETFEEAVLRYNLSEAELQDRHQNFVHQAYLFVFFATIVIGYAIYLVYQFRVLAGLVTFAMSVMLMILGLRAHFWAFQIAQRKIGCSWREWLNGKVDNFPIIKSKGDS